MKQCVTRWTMVGACVLWVFVAWISATSAQTVSLSQQTVVDWMFQNGLTMYDMTSEFRWDDGVMRGEAAKFFVEYAEAANMAKVRTEAQCQFSDIADFDYTLTSYITASCEYGLFKGYNGMFFPADWITEAQALAVTVRAETGLLDETMTPWRQAYYDYAVNAGILVGTEWVWSLDVPATRGIVGTRLYLGAQNSNSISMDNDDNDMWIDVDVDLDADVNLDLGSTSWTSVVSARVDGSDSESAWAYVTLSNGTEVKLADWVSLDGDNFAEVATFQEAYVSPDEQTVVFDVNWFEESYVLIYTVGDSEVSTQEGTFVERTAEWRAVVEACDLSWEECMTYVSVDMMSVGEFEQYGVAEFTCEDSMSALEGVDAVMRANLVLSVDWEEFMISEVDNCTDVNVSDRSTYDVPSGSVDAVYSFYAWTWEYFYLEQDGSVYTIYSTWERDELETWAFVYTEIATYDLEDETFMMN